MDNIERLLSSSSCSNNNITSIINRRNSFCFLSLCFSFDYKHFISHNDRNNIMTLRISVSIIVIAVFVIATSTISIPIISASLSQLSPNDIEEIRDNLVEVRLALQKGDLIEALQHLNNADEQLLLLAENATESTTMNTTNSTIA